MLLTGAGTRIAAAQKRQEQTSAGGPRLVLGNSATLYQELLEIQSIQITPTPVCIIGIIDIIDSLSGDLQSGQGEAAMKAAYLRRSNGGV